MRQESKKDNKRKYSANDLLESEFVDYLSNEIEYQKNRAERYDADFYQDEFVEYSWLSRNDYIDNRMEDDFRVYDEILKSSFHSYNIVDNSKGQNRLTFCYDWLQGTSKKVVKTTEIFREFFGKYFENIEIVEEDVYFNYHVYRKTILFSGLKIYCDRVNKQTGEIEDVAYFAWSGEKMRILEYILQENNKSMISFLSALYKSEFIFNRIDFAINDNFGLLDVYKLTRKINAGEYKDTFRKRPKIVTGYSTTIYFGFKTDCTIRIYDKKREIIEKHNLLAVDRVRDKITPFNRSELQLRNKYAQTFIEDLINMQNEDNIAANLTKSWITKKITFYSQNNKNKIIAPFWKKLRENRIENARVTFERLETDMTKSIKNIIRQEKSLSAVYFLYEHNINGAREMFKFLQDDKPRGITKEQYYKVISYLQLFEPNKIQEFKEKYYIINSKKID